MKRAFIAMVLIAVICGVAFGASFDLKNVSMKEKGQWTEILGQVVNNSGKDYKVIYLRLNVYDKYGNKLLASELVGFQNFMKGQTRTFSELFHETWKETIKVEVEFSSGS